MALTVADFIRRLPDAVDGQSIHLEDRKIHLNDGLVIELIERPDEKLGAMTLPRLQVYFYFSDWRPTAVERFLEKFDRVFHRGGG